MGQMSEDVKLINEIFLLDFFVEKFSGPFDGFVSSRTIIIKL